MATPRKSIVKSTTTGNVLKGATVSGGIAYLLALAMCNVLGLEPTPELLSALITIITVLGTPMLSRAFALIKRD